MPLYQKDTMGDAVEVLMDMLESMLDIEVTDREVTKQAILDAIVSTTSGG